MNHHVVHCSTLNVSRIIIPGTYIASITPEFKLRSDVYGALSVRVNDDLTRSLCSLDLITGDKDVDCLDFLLDWDFTAHVLELEKMTLPRSELLHIPTTLDPSTRLQTNAGDRAEFQHQLTREWLACFLSANFLITCGLGVSAVLSEDCYARVFLTDPRTDRTEEHRARFIRTRPRTKKIQTTFYLSPDTFSRHAYIAAFPLLKAATSFSINYPRLV